MTKLPNTLLNTFRNQILFKKNSKTLCRFNCLVLSILLHARLPLCDCEENLESFPKIFLTIASFLHLHALFAFLCFRRELSSKLRASCFLHSHVFSHLRCYAACAFIQIIKFFMHLIK